MASLKKNEIDLGSVSVTADGAKTYGQLFSELYNLIDTSKITGRSYLAVGSNIFPIGGCNSTRSELYFSSALLSNGSPSIVVITLLQSGSTYEQYYDGSNHSYTGLVLGNGAIVTCKY